MRPAQVWWQSEHYRIAKDARGWWRVEYRNPGSKNWHNHADYPFPTVCHAVSYLNGRVYYKAVAPTPGPGDLCRVFHNYVMFPGWKEEERLCVSLHIDKYPIHSREYRLTPEPDPDEIAKDLQTALDVFTKRIETDEELTDDCRQALLLTIQLLRRQVPVLASVRTRKDGIRL